jgi:CheY-like chemotaxis protein
MTQPLLLVAEDDPDDQVLIADALERVSQPVDLRFARDGHELLALLAGDADGKKPALVLMDLNMPGMDGRTALHKMRADPRLAGIPVVVLTTSNIQKDMPQCRELGALDCYQKPSSFLELVSILERVLAEFA